MLSICNKTNHKTSNDWTGKFEGSIQIPTKNNHADLKMKSTTKLYRPETLPALLAHGYPFLSMSQDTGILHLFYW